MRIELPSGTPAEIAGVAERRDQGLVIAPDILGLRPLFDDMVARLAEEQGWAVAAVEPFPGQESLSRDERLAGMAKLDHRRLVADLVAAADHLATERTGVIGFCMGGMAALEAAGTGRFHAAVPFYGMIRFPEGWEPEGVEQPIDAVRRPEACPVLAIVGTADPFTPADHVAELEAVPGVSVVRFEGAEHAFVHDPERDVHRPDDAAEAWRLAIDFLHR